MTKIRTPSTLFDLVTRLPHVNVQNFTSTFLHQQHYPVPNSGVFSYIHKHLL